MNGTSATETKPRAATSAVDWLGRKRPMRPSAKAEASATMPPSATPVGTVAVGRPQVDWFWRDTTVPPSSSWECSAAPSSWEWAAAWSCEWLVASPADSTLMAASTEGSPAM